MKNESSEKSKLNFSIISNDELSNWGVGV